MGLTPIPATTNRGKVNEWTRLAHNQDMAGATPAPATNLPDTRVSGNTTNILHL